MIWQAVTKLLIWILQCSCLLSKYTQKCTYLVFVVSQVDGDTVTFSFEMRSGREHNTPDKAMWGFSCTVRAQARTCFSIFFRHDSDLHLKRKLDVDFIISAFHRSWMWACILYSASCGMQVVIVIQVWCMFYIGRIQFVAGTVNVSGTHCTQ